MAWAEVDKITAELNELLGTRESIPWSAADRARYEELCKLELAAAKEKRATQASTSRLGALVGSQTGAHDVAAIVDTLRTGPAKQSSRASVRSLRARAAQT